MLETLTVYEIIAGLLLLDSLFAIIISYTKLGDNGIEDWVFIKRYLPLTKGWSLLYFLLTLYIGYLSFIVL